MQSTGSCPTTKRKFGYRARTKAKTVCIFLVLVGALLQLYPIRSPNSCQISLQGANVAVLMYGQARTLNRTHCSITEHILTPLLLARHKVHCMSSFTASWMAIAGNTTHTWIKYRKEVFDIKSTCRARLGLRRSVQWPWTRSMKHACDDW